MAAEDPDHAYWPSSPSSGIALSDPNGDRSGDVHQWVVWHANKPFTNYRETLARFVSEFGFQSLPTLSTISDICRPSRLEYNLVYHGVPPAQPGRQRKDRGLHAR